MRTGDMQVGDTQTDAGFSATQLYQTTVVITLVRNQDRISRRGVVTLGP